MANCFSVKREKKGLSDFPIITRKVTQPPNKNNQKPLIKTTCLKWEKHGLDEVLRIQIVVEVVNVLFAYPCGNIGFVVSLGGKFFNLDVAKQVR